MSQTQTQARRICHYAIATHLGGGERSLLELARSQLESPELGYEPWVLVPRSDGLLVAELKRARVPYDVLPMPQALLSMSRGEPLRATTSALLAVPGMPLYLLRFLALLQKRKPALIHTNALKCHALGAVVGTVARLPVVWHLRDILSEGSSLKLLRTLRKLPHVHAIANSKATAEAFGDPAETYVVHNGLRESEYPRERNRDFNRALKLPDGAPIIGILGVLARWKGQAEFLKMASSLIGSGLGSNAGAGFVIVGDSIYDTDGDRGYKDELRSLVDHLGLGSRVLFTGFRKDIPRVLGGLDLLVHASVRPEPFGRVVVEAMACEVPVIATNAGGIGEIIEPGKNGLLVPPGDVAAMAVAARRILGDPELARSLTQAGLETFRSRFTQEQYVRGVCKAYDSVLSR